MPRVNAANDVKAVALPEEFDDLVREHMPAAIHDEAAYGNAMEAIDRLTSSLGGLSTAGYALPRRAAS